MHRMLLLVLVALPMLVPASAIAAEVPADAEYSEEYIPASSPVPTDSGAGAPTDGDPSLHVDILRPKGVSGKVPVVLTVSPYTNHATQNGTDKDLDDPGITREGPSNRFYDFLNDAKLFKRGYAYAMVDLRGNGGSQGCNDWGGPGEQNDVKRAVEYLASQSWSNGKVALYGKSYDAWTGLMGLAQKPNGLAAVIAQEPVVDGYRYLYMNGVRFPNAAQTPALFQVIDAHPGSVNDTPQYHAQNVWANVVKPGCYARNYADQQSTDPASAYWSPRNLVDKVKGVTTPTFFMQGFIETNTKPDAVFDFWNNLAGTEHRAWFGQWDHVRGNEKVANKFATGRSTFVEEVMRFLDEHLMGVAPSVDDPRVVVQSSDGRFRSEEQWPPADSEAVTVPLKTGSYRDDGRNVGDGSSVALNDGVTPGTTPGNGIWTISQPLPHRAHLAGMPKLTVDVTAQPRANLVANVYSIAPDRKATLVSRGTYLLPGTGKATFDLYGQDWQFEPGRRIGVLLSSANEEWFDHVPTGQTVTVNSASLSLPFLRFTRTPDLSGSAGSAPDGYADLASVRAAAFAVAEAAFAAGAAALPLPPAMIDRPLPVPTPPVTAPVPGTGMTVQVAPVAPRAVAKSVASRIKLRVKRLKGRRLLITGSAPKGMKLTIKVLRGKKVVATRRVTIRKSSFRLVVKLRRAGRHTVRATGKSGRATESAAPRSARIR